MASVGALTRATIAAVETGARCLPRRISARVAAITESATLAVDAKAKALKAAGEPVIGFGGRARLPPQHVVEAAVKACRMPRFHKYTPAGGLPKLREAIAAKTKRDSGYDVSASQVLVTNGGKHAVYNVRRAARSGRRGAAARAVLDDLPRPIRLAGGVPVVLPTDEGHRLPGHRRPAGGGAHRPHQGAGVRVALNPTGVVYPRAEVEAIGRWAAERGVWVVTDEIYEHLTYGDHAFSSIARRCPSWPTGSWCSTGSPRPTP